MPTLPQSFAESTKLRLLMYGPPKSRKTWLAGTAAEAGYNVLLLDTENGAGILRQLSPAAQARIYRIDVSDDGKRAVAAEFVTRFCRAEKFNWDETNRKYVARCPEGATCITIDKSRFNLNTVVILDSYSALCWSVAYRYCLENNIDLSDASKTEWEGYRWAGQLLTWMITQLVNLPCHFILVGHQEMYEKRRENKVEWSRLQMKSASGPHAMTIAKNFDDVLYFSVRGSQVYVDARPEKDRDGGGRIIPPAQYKWEDLQFANICQLAGMPAPSQKQTVTELVQPDASSTGSNLPDKNIPQLTQAKTAASLSSGGLVGGKLQNLAINNLLLRK